MTQMDWTPEEIKAQNFRGGVFGYARKEVREFLTLISGLWSKQLLQNADLTRRVAELEKEVAHWRQREQEMTEHRERVVLEAQALREKTRAEAERLMGETEQRADEIRQKTENWLEEVIARVEETQRQKQNFLTAFRSSLDSHYELIRGEEADTEPLTARLTDVLRAESNPRSN